MSRKNGPRIPPFQHPIDESAFEPIQYTGDEDDYDYRGGAGGGAADERADYDGMAAHRYGDGGDGQYGTGPRYDDYAGDRNGGRVPRVPPPAAPSPGPGFPGAYNSPQPDQQRDSLDMRGSNPFADQHRAPARGAPPPGYGSDRPSYEYGSGAYGGGGRY